MKVYLEVLQDMIVLGVKKKKGETCQIPSDVAARIVKRGHGKLVAQPSKIKKI